MPRLPIVGGDQGNWGTILNDYLQVSLNADGTIQTAAIVQAGGVTSVNTIAPNSSGNVTLTATNVGAVPSSSVGSANGVASLNSSGLVSSGQLGSGSASSSTYLRGDGSWQSPPSAPVSSVFGRTGTVTAQSGDYTAAQVGALPSTDDLSAIANANANAANVNLNSHKITNLENGSAGTDAAAFGQIPTSLPPSGPASGDLSSSYPSPTVAKVNGATIPTSKTIVGTNSSGQVVDASTATLANNTTGNATTATNLAGGAIFPSYVAPRVVTLTDGSSVSINAASGNVFRWPLGGSSHTIGAPSNPVDGQILILRILYSGAYTPLFNAIYDFTAVAAPTWTATNGKVDEAGFRYNADAASAAGAWVYLGAMLGL